MLDGTVTAVMKKKTVKQPLISAVTVTPVEKEEEDEHAWR